MKKIAIVANSTWNIYNFRINLIRQIQAQNYQVVIISPSDKFLPLVHEKVSVKHIPIRKLSPQSKNPINNLFLLYEFYNLYKKENLDLILHYTIKPNIFGSIAANLVGVPCISTLTGLGYTFLNQSFTTHIVKLLYKFSLKNNKVVFHNNDDKNLFIQLNLLKSENTKIIKGSGVDTTFFQPLKKKENHTQFIFLFIGRLLYDKGIIEFLDAAKKIKENHKEIKCWVIGSFNSENPSAINKDVINHAVKNNYIQYWGEIKNVKQFIQKADVIVLPSYREGMPKAILEGMSMKKPIITTDAAGCREAIENNIHGYIVPVKNSTALASAMIKMFFLEKSELKKMGEKSRERVLTEFDEKIIAKQYLSLIRNEIE